MYFDSRDAFCKQPFGAVETGKRITLRLKLDKEWNPQNVRLFMYCVHTGSGEYRGMKLCGETQTENIYSVSFLAPKPALYRYGFEYDSNGQKKYIRRGRKSEAVVYEQTNLWQLTVYENTFQSVQSFAGGIIYQIFPDRFCFSGQEKDNVPPDRILRDDWGGVPEYRPLPNGDILNNDYFCGDLQGICAKLPYLKSLGVTCLYLNPIFEAHSNHRYDTADYLKIDPLLGTEEDFSALCKQAHALGIRILLDGVFNHTGSDSIYFNKKGRYPGKGAYNSKKSRYYGWYLFSSHPEEYACWWGVKIMPTLNKQNPAVQQFFMGKDGVLHHWLSRGADGFRLDVADELGDLFLDGIHARAKAENPESLILGEVWEDASNKVSYSIQRRYLQGKQLDSVMNYPFKDAILNFFQDRDGEEFCERILTIVENYPAPVLNLVMNSISTHDTLRAITALAGPPRNSLSRDAQANYRMDAGAYQHGKYLLKMAAALQFTLPGIPCIYYGDEAGMQGYGDPFNRGCYPWGQEDKELLSYFRSLGKMRANHPLFASADIYFWACRKDFLLYERSDGEESCIVAVNLNEQNVTEHIDLREYESLHAYAGEIADSHLVVPPYQAGICVGKRKKTRIS